jgi:hypothetical protein
MLAALLCVRHLLQALCNALRSEGDRSSSRLQEEASRLQAELRQAQDRADAAELARAALQAELDKKEVRAQGWVYIHGFGRTF